ncbi:MAG: hypothetical protein K2N87_17310 [Eubacterium sp.]|nr:hypothetical protein [Eubacterium sp.]
MNEEERLELVRGNKAIDALLRRIDLLNQVIEQVESLPMEQEDVQLKEHGSSKGTGKKQNDGWNQIQEQYQNVQKQLKVQQMQIEKLQNELTEYKEQYQAINQARKQYEGLSESIKDRIRNIFQNGSVYGITAACADWRNIEGLWEFTRRRIVEGEGEDVDQLVGLFYFLLDGYNARETTPKYERIQPQPGEKFDSDRHTILGIQTDGYVSGLKLPGIREVESKNILYKALITVGEENS